MPSAYEESINTQLLNKKESNTKVAVIAETNSFFIQSSSNEVFKINIYSADGKLVKQINAKANELIELPAQARNGLYLIHVYQANNKQPIVGKIILSKN